MAQVTNETKYADINVGDTLPDGKVVVDIDVRDNNVKLVKLRVQTYKNVKDEWMSSWYGAQFATTTYGESVTNANAHTAALMYGD